MSYSDIEQQLNYDAEESFVRWSIASKARDRRDFIKQLDEDFRKKCLFFDLIVNYISDSDFEKAISEFRDLERENENKEELERILKLSYNKGSDLWAYKKMLEGYRIINDEQIVCEADVYDNGTVDIDVYQYKDCSYFRYGISGLESFLRTNGIKNRNNWKLLSVKKYTYNKNYKKQFVEIDSSFKNIKMINTKCRYK